jgi:hypothetical protein
VKKKNIFGIAALIIIVAGGTFAVIRAKMKENNLPVAKIYSVTVSGIKA